MASEFAELIATLRVPPGTRVNLDRDRDPGSTGTFRRRQDAQLLLEREIELLQGYQARLAAQERDGVLVCLQAIDAGGKDSTIRHVMSGLNPQGVTVSSFKVPSADELRHDYLWRYAVRAPRRGQIGIFNRSHYEEVLVVRVHPENLDRQRLPKSARGPDIWAQRYREINRWERYLVDNGIRVVKLFLHLSKEEQRQRFLQRLDVKEKNFKFSAADVHERSYWDEYQRAFSEMLSNTSTEWAPWYVIPADHKWFTRLCAAAVLVETLSDIDPHYPVLSGRQLEDLDAARVDLEAEAPQRRSKRPRT